MFWQLDLQNKGNSWRISWKN